MLENHLQCELNAARFIRARNRSDTRCVNVCRRKSEIRRIGGIERLRAKLQPELLGEREALGKRQIEIATARTSAGANPVLDAPTL